MPQLDPSSFVSQILWLLISFFILFFIINKFVVPKMRLVFDSRLSNVRSALRTAEKMKIESEEVEEEYKAKLSHARKMIAIKISETSNEIAEEYGKKTSEAEEEFKKMLRQAERKIGKFRISAKAELDSVICDSAKLIIKELAGIDIKQETIEMILKEDKKL